MKPQNKNVLSKIFEASPDGGRANKMIGPRKAAAAVALAALALAACGGGGKSTAEQEYLDNAKAKTEQLSISPMEGATMNARGTLTAEARESAKKILAAAANPVLGMKKTPDGRLSNHDAVTAKPAKPGAKNTAAPHKGQPDIEAKFDKEAGHLTITTSRDGKRVRILYSVTGADPISKNPNFTLEDVQRTVDSSTNVINLIGFEAGSTDAAGEAAADTRGVASVAGDIEFYDGYSAVGVYSGELPHTTPHRTDATPEQLNRDLLLVTQTLLTETADILAPAT